MLNSCARSISGNRSKPESSKYLAQKAVFEYFKHSHDVFSIYFGKGLEKIDPLLRTRDSIVANGKVYFSDPMQTDLLRHPLTSKRFVLVIPDSLIDRFTYTNKDSDYEHDYALIHQFSPLLPTIEPGIFLMQHYYWSNACHETGFLRMLNRSFVKFKIMNDDVTYLEIIPLNNKNDLIVFGSFSRKKMEEALPGEKIVKFGW